MSAPGRRQHVMRSIRFVTHGFGVEGFGFRVQDLGFGFWVDSGFKL